MKINEVEALVGISKKSIRFYEEEGLLTPKRNSENGYRNYSDADVDTLLKIKALRKLGLPLEEIRSLQQGRLTVADAMHRHRITLERETENLRQAQVLCSQLESSSVTLSSLNGEAILQEMEQMEKEGTTFMNKQTNDIRKRYVAPIVWAVVMALLMAGVIWLFLWAVKTDPVGAPPLPLLALIIAMPAAVILGVGIALYQRIREIGKGEVDDAKKY